MLYKFDLSLYNRVKYKKRLQLADTMNQLTTKEIIKKEYQIHEKDSGSAVVQAALLTYRIDKLTEHLKQNKKDHSSRYGLIKMVSARRKMLDYLRRKDEESYQSIIKRLKLRR